MKYYKLTCLILSALVAVFSSAFVLQQAFGQEKPAPKGEMKPMGDMSMGGMMKQCHEHHDAMTKNMDEANKALEGAKQSNDMAKMRSAIDTVQKQLTEMKEHMAMCGNMMNMMEKMQGMGGMMKGTTK